MNPSIVSIELRIGGNYNKSDVHHWYLRWNYGDRKNNDCGLDRDEILALSIFWPLAIIAAIGGFIYFALDYLIFKK